MEYLDQSTLPPCGDALEYTTRAELLPTYLPEGYEVDTAWTGVGSDVAITVSDPAVTYEFAELRDGAVVNHLRISRDSTLLHLGGLNYTLVGESVRGHPGAVWESNGRTGAPSWHAEWTEAGHAWTSSGGPGPDEFRAALGGFVLSDEEVVDPTGHYTLAGVTGPHVPGVRRTQQFNIAGPLGDASSGTISIVVDEHVPGSWGNPPFGLRDERNGRVVFYHEREAASTLVDGSRVRIRYGPVEPWSIGEVHEVLSGIAPVERDDPRLEQIPLVASGQLPMQVGAGSPVYCLEE